MEREDEVKRRGRPTRAKATRPARTAEVETDLSEPVELDLAELSGALGYALRRAQLAVFEDFTARFAALDLTPAQFSVILVIGLNPGRKQTEIARSLGIQRTNFVVMLDHLERRGLAERRRSAADGRSHAIFLTRAGEALLDKARLMQVEQERALVEAIGEEEHALLLTLLGRVLKLKDGRPGT